MEPPAEAVDLHHHDSGAGEPMLLIHGTGVNADTWGSAFDLLAEHHRVIAYDRRGYARSKRYAPANHHVHADDAATLLTRLDATPAIVLGWSTGGIIALDLALRHPDLVSRLVLQEPPLFAKKDIRWELASNILPILLLARLGRIRTAAERLQRWTYRYPSGDDGYAEWPDDWRKTIAADAGTIVAEVNEGTGERLLKAEEISQIRHPVDGLVGELTRPYLRHCMDRVRRLLPQTEIHEVPQANHAIHLADPEVWVKAIG